VKPAFYVLGGVAAMLAFMALSSLLWWVMNELFGIYGLIIEFVVLFSAAGGWTGWLIYRERQRREPKL
jgi:hypothetical protein